MSTWLDDVIERVRDYDWTRPRSSQAEIGWSEAGGCRAYIGFRLDGAFPEQTDTWAAQRGTAIHEYLAAILGGQEVEAGGHKYFTGTPGARTEVFTKYRGIPGRADMVDATSVTDFKTTTLANAQAWAEKPDLLRQKRIQAHGYAAGLVDAGELPEDCTVRILVVPVDGTFEDWWAFEEPFDRDLADEGANRVDWVREQLAEGGRLHKDKPAFWCKAYCGFAYICRKPGEGEEVTELITDPEIAAAVDAYGEAHEAWSPLNKRKEVLAPMIRGLNGRTATGWTISMSKPGEPGEQLDMDAIKADYAARGEELPVRDKPGCSPRLTVTRVKDKPKGAKE